MYPCFKARLMQIVQKLSPFPAQIPRVQGPYTGFGEPPGQAWKLHDS